MLGPGRCVMSIFAVSHSSGGILIPAKMARLAKKLVAGVSEDRSSSLDLTATQID